MKSEARVASAEKKKTKKKKRAASDLDVTASKDVANIEHVESMDGVLVEDNLNEPTMGEKLESLNLQDINENKSQAEPEPEPEPERAALAKPPSADSINVLLKQALHADDRALLLDCLYTQDEKVIRNSVSLLSQSDVLKFLHSLISIIHSRGAILVCALPWLKSLLLQHASAIVSQESSLAALNSLYQLIESRVSTFQSALQLSSCIDTIYAGVLDDSLDENEAIVPVIYEDKDESDEEEPEDSMDTDQHSGDEEADGEQFGELSDMAGSEDGLSD